MCRRHIVVPFPYRATVEVHALRELPCLWQTPRRAGLPGSLGNSKGICGAVTPQVEHPLRAEGGSHRPPSALGPLCPGPPALEDGPQICRSNGGRRLQATLTRLEGSVDRNATLLGLPV